MGKNENKQKEAGFGLYFFKKSLLLCAGSFVASSSLPPFP